MDVRARPTTQFGTTIQNLYTQTTIPDSLVENLISAINKEEETRKDGSFHFSSTLFDKEEKLKQRIVLEQKRFYKETAAYEDLDNKLQNKINEINVEISQLKEKAIIQKLIKIGDESELQLEKIDDEENLKFDTESESCFKKYIFCCCIPSKIKNDQAKIALLDQKTQEFKSKTSTHPIVEQLKQLYVDRATVLQQQQKLKRPAPLHEKLKEELAKTIAEIDLQRNQYYGGIHRETMFWIICTYEYCMAHQNESDKFALYLPLLTNLLRPLYCIDMNNRSAIGIFNEYHDLSDVNKLALFNRKDVPEHMKSIIALQIETKAIPPKVAVSKGL